MIALILMYLGLAAAAFTLGTVMIVTHPLARGGSGLLVLGCVFLFLAVSTWRRRERDR
jgi:hypothetical protein